MTGTPIHCCQANGLRPLAESDRDSMVNIYAQERDKGSSLEIRQQSSPHRVFRLGDKAHKVDTLQDLPDTIRGCIFGHSAAICNLLGKDSDLVIDVVVSDIAIETQKRFLCLFDVPSRDVPAGRFGDDKQSDSGQSDEVSVVSPNRIVARVKLNGTMEVWLRDVAYPPNTSCE